MQKRNVLSSPRLNQLKRERRKILVNKFLIIIFGFIVLCALGAYFSRLEGLNISEIEVSGNKVVDADAIENAVKEKIAGKYIWLFPKSNILYYPNKYIKKELQNKFHRLDNINVSIKDRKTLAVSVTERVALYLWCGQTQSPEEKCYFLDDSGYIFDEAPYFSGEVYFKFYGKDGLDFENPIGAYFSEQNFKELLSFKDILLGMGLKPVRINILDNGDVELFLARGSGEQSGPKILFKSAADLKNVAENLQAALGTDPLMSGFKKKYSSLLYIDLRFGNKVYFKFIE